MLFFLAWMNPNSFSATLKLPPTSATPKNKDFHLFFFHKFFLVLVWFPFSEFLLSTPPFKTDKTSPPLLSQVQKSS